MRIHPTLFANLLPVALALSAVSAFAQETTPPAPPVAASSVTLPASPFVTAKTVIGKGTFSVADGKGKFTPFFDVVITVDGPGRYRIDATPLSPSMVASGPSFYFSDAVKQYEYNSLNKRYKIQDAPVTGERPMSQLASMAGLDLVVSPGKSPRATVNRVITEETVDNRRMVAITDNEPARPSKDGSTAFAFRKTWIDVSTGLPFRTLEGMNSGGVVKPNLQFDYTDWKLNPPVAKEAFVWTKPAGAETEEESTLAVGTVAPDFKAVTPEGKIVRLSDYKGKVVVLDFWATWCGPCQRSLPHLQQVYQAMKSKGVSVLALCVWDDRAKYDAWIKTNKTKYTFPTAFDPAGRGAKDIAKTLYKVTGIPTQYVIGADGKIAAGFIGFEEGSPRLENALRKLTAAPVSKNAPQTGQGDAKR